MDELSRFKLDIDGVEKEVQLVTRLSQEEFGLEYGYCYEVDENDTDNTQKELIAFRIRTEADGTDSIIAIKSEKERQFAYNLYKRAVEEAN